MNCSCSFEYYNAVDPEDYYEEEAHAQHHGCTCEWKFIYNPDREGGCNWGHGFNKRVEEKVNCPFHKVMF